VCLFTILAAIIAATELAVLATKASAFAPRLRDEPWFMLLLHACTAGGTIAVATNKRGSTYTNVNASPLPESIILCAVLCAC
jgi:hypothetical protein